TAGALLAGGFQNQNQDIGSGLSSLINGLLGGRTMNGTDGIIGLLSKYLRPGSSPSLYPDDGSGNYGPQLPNMPNNDNPWPDDGSGNYGPQLPAFPDNGY